MTNENKHPSHRIPLYRRPLVIIGSACLVVVIAVSVVLIARTFNNESETNPVEVTETTEQGTETTPDPIETPAEDSTDNIDDEKHILQYEGENPNNLDYLTGSITRTEYDPDTESLDVFVIIDQFLSDGTCVTTLQEDDIVATSAEQVIEPDVSTSHCGPISIPVGALTSADYILEISITSTDRTGLVTQTITLNKGETL